MKRTPVILALLALTSSLAAEARELANLDAYAASAPLATPTGHDDPSLPSASVSSIDEKTFVPTFLWSTNREAPSAAKSLSAESAARAHFAKHALRYGLSSAALRAATVEQIHDLDHGGIVVVFRQRIDGIEVFRSDMKVLLDRSFGLVAIGGHLHSSGANRPKGRGFALPERDAIAVAMSDLVTAEVNARDLVPSTRMRSDRRYYELARSSRLLASLGLRLDRPALAKRVYYPLPDRLVSAYYIELWSSDDSSRGDAYAYVVAADDGRLLSRENLTHDDSFTYRTWADPNGDRRPADGPLADFTPHPTGTPDQSYPDTTVPSLVVMDGFNKNPNASFDSWLSPGATMTSGNNVDAYTDDDNPDGFSAADLHGVATSPGVFNRIFATNADPLVSESQRMASVIQIFYTTNWLHDWWYDSGFVEAAGNAQKDNYGRGGVAGDPLHAEAQDGAPGKTNNADMSAGIDGESPRMQMYVWDPRHSVTLSAQPLNQSFVPVVAGFGSQSFSLTGTLALADDGNAPTTDACQPLGAGVSGKVALIDRGTCTFKQKAVYAEQAGAVGVILVDNQVSAAPPSMPDAQPAGSVSIPMVSVTQGSGNTLKAALGNGAVTVTLAATTSPTLDGTIDNTIVAHEWGHYLHLRQVACGNQQCAAQSEGWGDFSALMLAMRPTDDFNRTYALAQYATGAFGDPGYFGIRRYPYSGDLTKNPLTFKHITSGVALPGGVPTTGGGDNAEVHNAGEIWAEMLFENYAALIARSKDANSPYTSDQARRRLADYVEGGLKLAPTSPTYTEQRDAILAAALAADSVDFAAMAQAFAKRGAGSCAVSPARDSQDFSGLVESFAVAPNLQVASATVDDSLLSCDQDGFLDAGEHGKITVEIMNAGPATNTATTVTITTGNPNVSFPNGASLVVPSLGAYQKASATIDVGLAPGVSMKDTFAFSVSAENASACTPKVTLDASVVTNIDLAPASSTIDDVEPPTTAWVATGNFANEIWARSEPTVGNHAWLGADHGSPSDTALTSPPISVSAVDDFVVSLKHRYSFETSQGVYWDGGVLEYSTDGGVSWADVSGLALPGYGGTIGDPQNQAKNVLKGRAGFVSKNPAWPSTNLLTLNFAKSLAGKSVRLRFRIGTDDASGDFGWELDDFVVQGITNTPFDALVVDAGMCALPAASAGPDQIAMSGDLVHLDGSQSSDPNALPLSFAWSQKAGPVAALSDPSSSKPSFTAPLVAAPTTFTFQLDVSDSLGSASDSVDVVVHPPMGSASASGSGGAGGMGGTGGSGGMTGSGGAGGMTGSGGGAGGMAATGGAGGMAGTGGGGAGGTVVPQAPTLAIDDTNSGCGCEAAGSSPRTAWAPALAMAALVVLRRKRRR